MELAILVLSVMWKQCFRVLHRVLNVVTSIILLSSLEEWNGTELFLRGLESYRIVARDIFSMYLGEPMMLDEQTMAYSKTTCIFVKVFCYQV